mmetsp:Transcript_3993/g.13996  ORF Transcript_3993/g.13996 Transcript_3993/m.13996 type:complete len:218 (-) Transcript_3993:1038-1691(-)
MAAASPLRPFSKGMNGSPKQAERCASSPPPTVATSTTTTADESTALQEEEPPLRSSPTSLTSRVGRERQRYADEGQRLVAGCIPVRVRDGELEVLMVSSAHKQGFIFPKGGWENDETAVEAAMRESWEEAGVRGTVEVLGEFEFESKRAARNGKAGAEGRCLARVFVMRVAEELEEWPEQNMRVREWCSPPDAISRCRHEWMQAALRKWSDQTTTGG